MKPRVALVLLALVVLWGYGEAKERAGRNAERGKVAQARVDTAYVEVRRTDTVYRDRLRTLTKTLTLYDSARVTDTLTVVRHDTAVVFIERAVADSAINSCRRLVLSCDDRNAAQLRLIRALENQVKAERAKRPGFIEVWSWRLGAFAVGYAAGR